MSRTVAVIGAGSVGTALAKGLDRTDHEVIVGVRTPDAAKYDGLPTSVRLATMSRASAGAEVVILAVPADALAETVPALALAPGQVVIDATNAVRSPLPTGFDTLGEYVASLVPPDVPVVKAFNTIGAELLDDGRVGDANAFLPIAGDDAGRPVAVEIGSALGFDVADLGGRQAMRIVEDHARLWIHLVFRCGWSRDFGFAVIRP